MKRFAWVLFAVVFGQAGCDQSSPPTAPTSRPVQVRKALPAFGVEVSTPPGWNQVPPSRGGRIAEWKRGHSTLSIDAMRVDQSADATAIELASDFGGKLDPMVLPVDGERGVRLRAEPVEDKPHQPTDWILVKHSDYLYLIAGCDTDGRRCGEAVESLARSLKWIAIEHPTRHLEFHDKPLPLFDGYATINFPRIMCAESADERIENPGLAMVIMDLQNNHIEVLASFMLVEAPTTKSGRQLPTYMVDLVTRVAKPKQPLRFESVAGDPRRRFSQQVGMEPPPYRMWQQVHGRAGYLMLDETTAIFCLFQVSPRNHDDMGTYMAVVDRMIDSIAIHEKPVTTQPTSPWPRRRDSAMAE